MRTKVTLILLFLNVALFFFIFKFERGWRTERASLEARRRVLGAETADIRSLKISGPGVTTVNLVRQGGNWSLAEPIEWPANPHAISRIVNELQFLEHETSFSVADLKKNRQSLADYGLDEPRLFITFTSGVTLEGNPANASQPITLSIGDETKVGNRLYILSPDGQRVHVVNLSLARSVTLPIEDLRADTVFSIPVFEARSLNLQNAANLRIRVRREGSRWSFEAPIIARASKPAVELTINALNALRVHNFVNPGTAETNPATNATLRVTLEGNNRRETLILGTPLGSTAIANGASATTGANHATEPDVEYYAMLEGKATLFTVDLPARLITALRNAQEILRDATVLDLDPAAVTAVNLTAPNQPELALQRLEAGAANSATGGWQLVRRNGAQGLQTSPADDELVDSLLQKLSKLSARKFVSDAPSDADLETWGFNRPEREITLSIGRGPAATTQQLQIGVSSDRLTYARVTNARFVYLVDGDILSATAVSPLNYRERLLRKLSAAASISSLQITDLAANSVIIERALGLPGTTPDESVDGVVAQLRALRAQRFVQEGFPNKVTIGDLDYPWKFRLDARITLPGGSGEQTETLTLFFTDRIGGATQYAGSPELNAVVEIPQPLLDALWKLTYADKDPGPPPAIDPPPPPATP